MFHKDDERFATLMTNSLKRQVEILDLTRKRNITGWIGILMAVTMIVSKFFGETWGLGMGFLTLVLIIAFKFDSDVKLLKVIDRLQSNDNLPKS